MTFKMSDARNTLAATVSSDPPLVTTSITSPSAAVSISPSAFVSIACSVAFSLSANSYSNNYNFRMHPRVKQCLQLFAFVELESVKATVMSAYSVQYKADHTITPLHIRHGIAPRGTVARLVVSAARARTATSEAVEATYSGVVEYVPHLHSFLTGSIVVASQIVEFSAGSFPPGVLLDFQSTETRFNYAQYFVGITNPVDDSKDAVHVQLDFTVRCSGSGFGHVY
jgi:predicted HicB family RNase H-like nuclease